MDKSLKLEWHKAASSRMRCLRITQKEEKQVRNKLQAKWVQLRARARMCVCVLLGRRGHHTEGGEASVEQAAGKVGGVCACDRVCVSERGGGRERERLGRWCSWLYSLFCWVSCVRVCEQ